MFNPAYKYRTSKRRQKRFPLQARKMFNKNTARIELSSKVLDCQRWIPSSVTEEKGFQYCVNCTFQPAILNSGNASNISIMCEHVYMCLHKLDFLLRLDSGKKFLCLHETLSCIVENSTANWDLLFKNVPYSLQRHFIKF